MLSKNCHHFSDALCIQLGVARVPAWINDLAETCAFTAASLDIRNNIVDRYESLHDPLTQLWLDMFQQQRKDHSSGSNTKTSWQENIYDCNNGPSNESAKARGFPV